VTARRIQLRRTRGWRKPPGAVVVSRPSKWGNPFPAAEHTPAGHAAVVEAFREHLRERPELVAAIRAELAGRDLCCWCPSGWPCHADVLLAVAAGEDP
jgi:hypothetical protein